MNFILTQSPRRSLHPVSQKDFLPFCCLCGIIEAVTLMAGANRMIRVTMETGFSHCGINPVQNSVKNH